jgi:MFS family permease
MLLHFAFVQLAWASGAAFAGVYLLKIGFSLPAALAAYAGIMCVRFFLRFAGIEIVRRVGYRLALAIGTVLCAFEFFALIGADSPSGLACWILISALAEACYWPVHHAVTASTCAEAARGSQIGMRQAVMALMSVAGPVLAGTLLARVGPGTAFATSAAMCLVGVVPILFMSDIAAGPVPSLRQALSGADRLSAILFATDGWICAGFLNAWALVLFGALGSSYEAFGWTGAAAAIASAVASLVCGRALDRGKRRRYLVLASVATAGSVLLRAFSFGSPTLSVIAALSGAAVPALYVPVTMSVIYGRAKASGRAYGFHLTLEAAWDAGMVAGTLAAACVAICSPLPSLCVLPSVLGVAVVYACVSRTHPATDAAHVAALALAD